MVSSPITDQASPQINHSEEQDLAQLCGVSWEVQVVLVEPDLQRSDFAGPPRAEELSAESFTPQAAGAELRHLYTYSSNFWGLQRASANPISVCLCGTLCWQRSAVLLPSTVGPVPMDKNQLLFAYSNMQMKHDSSP